MKYRVEITAEAETEIKEAYLWIFGDSPANAARWRRGLLEAVRSLSQQPTRCTLAPESAFFKQEIRQLLYGKRGGVYRVLFIIEEKKKTVSILHIRHAAREYLQPDS
jgi:plasmid stabilization system protein ParE